MHVFFGIDWSHTHHEACFLDQRGQVLSRLTGAHTVDGLTQLARAPAVGRDTRAVPGRTRNCSYPADRLSVGSRLSRCVRHSTWRAQGRSSTLPPDECS